ncbi:MAG: hypothetical protein MI725_05200 [Pirellulales bacterium]|nr:hypothetical protein [Pirellulales bacterium]
MAAARITQNGIRRRSGVVRRRFAAALILGAFFSADRTRAADEVPVVEYPAPVAVARTAQTTCEKPRDCRRNSLFPSSVSAPEETPLYGLPQFDRPLFGPPVRYRAPVCQPLPPTTGSTTAPGFMRSLTRHGLTSPVPPAVISAHAPPWEQLPTPAELHGGILVRPHCHDRRCHGQQYSSGDFSPDPFYGACDSDSRAELGIYGDKRLNRLQRPALEWGLPFYLNGPLPRSQDWLGPTNLVQPKFYVYGDYRTAVAQNKNVGDETTIWATRLNLDIDFWITATERFHMFWGPLDERNEFSSVTFDDGDIQYNDAWDGWDERTDTLFFEGDLGYLLSGLSGRYSQLDIPFAVGYIPLLFQNGIWMEDAFLGAAVTVPARNKPGLDWSNFDTTFFVGFDEITSNRTFNGDNDAANMVGFTTFIEQRGGYLEIGYAFLEDSRGLGRSYHNIAASYTRRYLNLVSNSMRVIVNTGQDGPRNLRTADGVLLLMENSFLTRNPYNVIPYANFFAGYGTPQSAARLQGPLKNTGINFESDLLTGFPLLDDSANNTYGGAIGVDLLGQNFEQQLILELAFLQVFDDDATRVAPGDQYAVGARFQHPLNHTYILRADVMYGWLDGSEDISGIRMELRRKF